MVNQVEQNTPEKKSNVVNDYETGWSLLHLDCILLVLDLWEETHGVDVASTRDVEEFYRRSPRYVQEKQARLAHLLTTKKRSR